MEKQAKYLNPVPFELLPAQLSGRENVVEALKQQLARHKIIQLRGDTGTGKSTAALDYLSKTSADYQHIAWIQLGPGRPDFVHAMAEDQSLLQALHTQRIHTEANLPKFFEVLRRMSELPGRNLLVIDNWTPPPGLPETQEDLSLLDTLLHHSGWEILITSDYPLPLPYLTLAMLSPEQASELFFRYCGESKKAALAQKSDELLGLINYHPLLIRLLALHLKPGAGHLSCEAVIKAFRKQQQKNRIYYAEDFIEQLIELSHLSFAEKIVLLHLAVLPVRMPLDELYVFLLPVEPWLGEMLERLDQKGWIKISEKYCFTHPAIQNGIKFSMEANAGHFVQLLDFFGNKFFEKEKNFGNMHYLPYLLAMAGAFYVENREYARLLHNIGDFYRLLGYPDAVYLEHQKALTQLQLEILGEDHAETAISLYHTAMLLTKKDQADIALELAQKCLEVRSHLLPPSHPDLLDARALMSAVLALNEHGKEALALLQNTIESMENSGRAPNYQLFEAYNLLSSIYMLYDKLPQSLKATLKAVELAALLPEVGQIEKAMVYEHVSRVYEAQEKFKEGIPWLHKAIELREQVQDKDHPDLALVYHELGELYTNSHKSDEAVHYLSKATAIYEKLSMGDPLDSEMASAYAALAMAYLGQEKTDDALAMQCKAHAILERELDQNAPVLAESYTAFFAIYSKQLEFKKAHDTLLKAIAIHKNNKDEANLAESLMFLKMVEDHLKKPPLGPGGWFTQTKKKK